MLQPWKDLQGIKLGILPGRIDASDEANLGSSL